MKALITTILFTLSAFAITVGNIPPSTTIGGDNGGLVEDGGEWSSSTIKDKVYVMFYVDPDEKSVNEHFSQALKAKKYDRSSFGSMAIINLGATWKPNFIIESILKSKQEEFPNTIYVKDKEKVLVDAWEIGDDASNILIFSKDSRVLFYKSGKMEDADMQKAFNLIENNI
jgi:hypothetical protein